jgi:hypothetical protein
MRDVARSAIKDTGMTIAKIPLVQAALLIPTDPSSLRRVLNRFGLNDRQEDGQRVVDPLIVRLFQRTKGASGYLAPYWLRTRDDLLAAAAEIPASEMSLIPTRPFSAR